MNKLGRNFVVDINLIKKLREETGAGMSDCKSALESSSGDITLAKEHLRKVGASKAIKKFDRVAGEGVIALKADGPRAGMIELNSETDFVARNDKFRQLAANVVAVALKNSVSDVTTVKGLPIESGATVEESLLDHITSLGENLILKRVTLMNVSSGIIAGYVHGALSEGVGKIGALVALESTGNADKLKELGKQLAMHIVAMRPASISIDSLDATTLQKERAIIETQVQEMNKPQSVAEKIIEGMVSKFYQEAVLLEQALVMDGKTKVADFIKSFEPQVGAPIKITGYNVFVVGEGESC